MGVGVVTGVVVEGFVTGVGFVEVGVGFVAGVAGVVEGFVEFEFLLNALYMIYIKQLSTTTEIAAMSKYISVLGISVTI